MVTFEARGKPVIVAQCHCQECRRLSGTGHSIGAMFEKSDVTVQGKLGEFKYTSANGSQVTKAFCPTCASPIYGTNTNAPDHLTLSLGTMNDAENLTVEVVIFDRDAPHWDQLGPDVMRFDTQPDWTPPSS